jgi:signal transduction histidine kinase
VNLAQELPARDTDARRRADYEERVCALQGALRKRERELEILARVVARIHAQESVQQILDISLEETLLSLDLQTAWVFMGDQKDRKLSLVASRGVAPAYLREIRATGLRECLCAEVFWTGHRMQARNTTDCPRMSMIIENLSAPVAHACIPLRFQTETRGVLNVAARPGEEFSAEELRFLETLGEQICLAIERAGHLREEHLRNQELRAISAINRAIGGSLDVRDVVRALGQCAFEVLGADTVQVFLGGDLRRLRVGYLSGPHPELEEGQALDLAEVLPQGLLEKGETLRVHDWGADARVDLRLASRWGLGAVVIVPLLARDRVLGLLVVARQASRAWTDEQVDLAELLAAQSSVALDNARLYRDVTEAYRELTEAQRRILQSEKMAALGTFASGLAHEIRNPLNSIGLQLSILERRVRGLTSGLSASLPELTDVIREEIRRLEALVDDFLLFARTDRMQVRSTAVDSLIEEVVRLIRPEARARGVSLRRRAPHPAIPNLPLDAEKMKQVLINLVQNAIEAMPGGGVVTLESGLAAGQVQVVVGDNGPGLPEGLDVFQLFVTTKPKGTGLGLAIAQHIVLLHGGEIAAASEPGKGTRFTLSLPLARTTGAAAEGGVHAR